MMISHSLTHHFRIWFNHSTATMVANSFTPTTHWRANRTGKKRVKTYFGSKMFEISMKNFSLSGNLSINQENEYQTIEKCKMTTYDDWSRLMTSTP